MDFKLWLNETPISNFSLQGKWEPTAKKYGFHNDDIGILTSPKAVEKIKRLWEKTPYDFDLYFIRSPNAYKHVEVGEVKEDFIKNTLKLNIPINHDHITVIFTNNRGDERIPMTAWTLAHRFGHAIRLTNEGQRFNKEIKLAFDKFMNEVYGFDKPTRYLSLNQDISYNQMYNKTLKYLAQAIGTMKSAREGNLRNFNEFVHEILAQYLLTGSVKFNPLPNQVTQGYAWGRPVTRGKTIDNNAMHGWQEELEIFQDQMHYECDDLIRGMLGRIFVM